MDSHKRVYSTACMVSHRPEYRTEAPAFFRCPVCGAVTVVSRPAGGAAPGPEDGGRCCGQPMVLLKLGQGQEDAHRLDYCVFGGFAHNTIRVEVDGGYHPMTQDHHIQWIYLRTYQGGQLKYLPRPGESAALFSMAGEDAYSFCDREVCRMGWEHCLFQCKRGHVAYAYCNQHGLFRLAF